MQCFGFGQELPSAGGQGNKLFSSAPRAEVLSDFLEGPTETLGRGKCTEAQHLVISLLDPAMILLDAPVQISIAAIVNFRPERFPNRARVRIVPVGGHLDRG